MIRVTFMDGSIEKFPEATVANEGSADREGRKGVIHLIRPQRTISSISAETVKRIDYID